MKSKTTVSMAEALQDRYISILYTIQVVVAVANNNKY